MSQRFSRRRFLGGAGTLLALPFLESIAGAAPRQAPKHPTRLLFYFVPNGIIPNSYDPTPFGPDWEAKGILTPLDAHRDEIIVFSELASLGYLGGAGPHTKACGTFLTCTPIEASLTGQVQSGISIDQIAAAQIGSNSRYPSLQLGAFTKPFTGFCEEKFSCAYLQTISWSGPSTPLPKITDAQATFDLLCSGFDPVKARRDALSRSAATQSVLDVVREEAQRLRLVLGQQDRYRMDEYLDGIRALERKVSALPKSCPVGSQPAVPIDMQAQVQIMTDLMVVAMQTDQTRVISFMLDDGFASTTYEWMGLPEGHHWYTHHEGDAAMIEAVNQISTWQVAQFAYLLERMRNTPEGEGNLLDHSLVMFGNAMSECNNHMNDNVPTILAGRGGGVVTPGISLQVAPSTPRANLYISMLRAVGIELDTFGVAGDGPLTELGF